MYMDERRLESNSFVCKTSESTAFVYIHEISEFVQDLKYRGNYDDIII